MDEKSHSDVVLTYQGPDDAERLSVLWRTYEQARSGRSPGQVLAAAAEVWPRVARLGTGAKSRHAPANSAAAGPHYPAALTSVSADGEARRPAGPPRLSLGARRACARGRLLLLMQIHAPRPKRPRRSSPPSCAACSPCCRRCSVARDRVPPHGGYHGQICDTYLTILALLPTPAVAVASLRLPSPRVSSTLTLEQPRVLAVLLAILCGARPGAAPRGLPWRGKLRCSELPGSTYSLP